MLGREQRPSQAWSTQGFHTEQPVLTPECADLEGTGHCSFEFCVLVLHGGAGVQHLMQLHSEHLWVCCGLGSRVGYTDEAGDSCKLKSLRRCHLYLPGFEVQMPLGPFQSS